MFHRVCLGWGCRSVSIDAGRGAKKAVFFSWGLFSFPVSKGMAEVLKYQITSTTDHLMTGGPCFAQACLTIWEEGEA